ncbi:MAG: hypothetical protein OEU60_10730 [Gammaproteobacteria bacterium]|nr:hypothetical protein [Gammaproteobacteria bacterium]
MTRKIIAVLCALVLTACGPAAPDMDDLAREYLYLELSMGLHDSGHVDAYFGPAELKAAAEETALSLDQILTASADLAERLAAIDTGDDEMFGMRIAGLIARLQALDTRIAINKGEFLSFDDESMALFGSAAPDNDAAHFETILQELDALLPGDAPLSKRVEDFNNQFVIPLDRLPDVFEAAMAECRKRTLLHIDLPEGESFTIEYVNDKPWSGYNWYQGNSISLIQVNTDFPIYISRAVDLGCHEGYPGHHTFNALLEKNLVNDAGWLEFSLYPLFSPQSLIAEGSGNYGIDLAFPGAERADFEKAVLFPLAGLDAETADRYYEVAALIGQLNFAGNEAARDYLNGEITREEAAEWLQTYGMMREDKSLQRTRFIDTYRSYVINYNHGKVMVADYVERDGADIDERWARFEAMLSSPMLPADLK